MLLNTVRCKESVTLLGHLELPGNYITDVWGYVDSASQKEYALVGGWGSGVFIIDVTDPSTPGFVDSFGTNAGALAIDVRESFVYAAEESGLLILDWTVISEE